MPDLPDPESPRARGAELREAQPPGMPLWVKVFGIIALALVAVFLIVHLTGHGLGEHMH